VASFVRIDLDAGSSAFVKKRFWWHEDPSAIEEQLARLCAGFGGEVKARWCQQRQCGAGSAGL